jgi:hypothetical protein
MEQLIKELEATAKAVHYGNIKLEMTISRGKIVKLLIREKERVILIDKKN